MYATIKLNSNATNVNHFRAVVVAHSVERLLTTPEIGGSNPVIGKFYLLSNVLKKTKRGREWPIFQKTLIVLRTKISRQSCDLDSILSCLSRPTFCL